MAERTCIATTPKIVSRSCIVPISALSPDTLTEVLLIPFRQMRSKVSQLIFRYIIQRYIYIYIYNSSMFGFLLNHTQTSMVYARTHTHTHTHTYAYKRLCIRIHTHTHIHKACVTDSAVKQVSKIKIRHTFLI